MNTRTPAIEDIPYEYPLILDQGHGRLEIRRHDLGRGRVFIEQGWRPELFPVCST